MPRLLLALHLLFAIFAVGPLVHAATTAARGVRKGDAAATASSARMLKVYSGASVLVIIAGFALLPQKMYGHKLGEFRDLWVWLSLVLWLVSLAVVFAVLVPALEKATATIGRQEPLDAVKARVAAGGGIVGVLFAVIVFLMVYRPGS